MIRFACPGCAAAQTAPDQDAGAVGRCPRCRTEYRVPDESRNRSPGGPIEIAPCPGCGVRLSAESADLGTDVECPYCKTVFPSAPPPPARPRRDRPSTRVREADDEPDRRRPTRSGRPPRPGQVSAVGGLLLGGGIWSLLYAGGLAVGSGGLCCLWPGTTMALVTGILSIVRGSTVLSDADTGRPPTTLFVLLIVGVMNGDVVGMSLGIAGLVLLNDRETRDYFDRQR